MDAVYRLSLVELVELRTLSPGTACMAQDNLDRTQPRPAPLAWLEQLVLGLARSGSTVAGEWTLAILRRLKGQSRAYGHLPRKVRRYEALYDPRYGDWHDGPDGQVTHATVELEVGRLWYALVMLLRPSRVLETGTWRGYSTCCIAAALAELDAMESPRSDTLRKRSVISIDIERRPHLWEGTHLERSITFVEGHAAQRASEINGEFDLLVLDSDHSYKTVMEEIIAFEPRLVQGGHIFFHDSQYFDGVGAAIAQLHGTGRFETITLDTPRHTLDFDRLTTRTPYRCPGVTLVRKKAAGDALVFDPSMSQVVLGDVKSPSFLRQDEASAK